MLFFKIRSAIAFLYKQVRSENTIQSEYLFLLSYAEVKRPVRKQALH